MSDRPSSPVRVFVILCAVAVVALAGAVYWGKTRGGDDVRVVDEQAASSTIVAPQPERPVEVVPEPASSGATAVANDQAIVPQPPVDAPVAAPAPTTPSVPKAARVFFRHTGLDANYGKLAYVDGPNGTVQFAEPLSCEVAYVGGGKGICLTAKRGIVTTYGVKLFDAGTFATLSELPLLGVPSRNRVSVDGRLAAYTAFLSGHGYSSLDFTTQTVLIDVAAGKVVADLEADFVVLRDGVTIKEQDFNFWGVTFTPDAKGFFATLSTGGKHYLVKGDIDGRTMTVIHENVECPSLSPDGKRIAYKKRFLIDNRIVWQLHVLDLATGKETALAEQRSIDDQLEWLDDTHVLYSVPEADTTSGGGTDVWVAPTNIKDPPRPYLSKAYSPSVVR